MSTAVVTPAFTGTAITGTQRFSNEQANAAHSDALDSNAVVRIPSAQPRLRLTKRGRVVFTSLAALPVVAGVMLLALNGGGATATDSSGAELQQITVQAGQSLWSLAEDIAPGVDPRDVVSDIQSVNRLETGGVQAGQVLLLPAEYSTE